MIKLKALNKLAYGVGHVHNDIAATIMFSFSLLYMQVKVTRLNKILYNLYKYKGNIGPVKI